MRRWHRGIVQVGGARLSATLAARIPAEIGAVEIAAGLRHGGRVGELYPAGRWSERIINTGEDPCPDDEVWVADADGNPLPPGEIGRLMTRGPYTFRGYFSSPQHNASAFDTSGFTLFRRSDLH